MSHYFKSLLPFQQRLLLAISVGGVIVIFTFVALGVAQRTSETSPTAAANTLNSQSADREAKALLFAVQPYGFEPSGMDVDEGRYLLVVQNRSGLTDLLVTLQTDDTRKVHEEHTQLKQLRKRLDLNKGTYHLTVQNHPEWSCVIRVH